MMSRMQRLSLSLICLLGSLLLLWQPPARAQVATPEAAALRLYDFGLHLFHLGEYYRAITELKRFTLFFADHERRPAAQLLIGLALQGDGAYEDAFLHFQHLAQADATSEVGRVAAFKLGELRFLQQHYPQAVEHFERFLRAFPDGPLHSRTTYLLGLSHALLHQYTHAQQVLTRLPAADPLARKALGLQQEMQFPSPPAPRSPRLAGILAGLLPGAGHLYVGKPLHAAAAFLLNGLFLSGAVYAFLEGFEATAAILLYFEAGWYLGSINSATAAAREANLHHQRTAHQRLYDTYTLPPLSLENLQAPGFGLRLTF